MATGIIPKQETGSYRKGDTIDFSYTYGNTLTAFLGTNNIAFTDIILSKTIPSNLTPTMSNDVTVSSVRGNGATESTLSATFRTCARQNANILRISFNLTGGAAYHFYSIGLTKGTITFT